MPTHAACLHRSPTKTRITILECGLLKTFRNVFKKGASTCIHFNQCRGKRSLVDRLFFISLSLCLITQHRLCTHAAVARVPDYLDLDAVADSSRCEVREEILLVRHEHPSLPSHAFYSPSCVKLNRCSGCCDSDTMRCVATSQYTTKMQISERTTLPTFSYKVITLEFTHHGSCECRSIEDTRPVCVPEACESHETWDPGECRCMAVPGMRCVQTTCNQGQRLNHDTCQCESSCVRQSCPRGGAFNVETCKCERCPVQACPPGAIWNRATCSCQCRPCHSRRRRIGANTLACLCSCKFDWKLRAFCESRRRPCPCRSLTGPRG